MFKKLAITTKINFEKELNHISSIKVKGDFKSLKIQLPIKKIDNNNVHVGINVYRNYNSTLYGMDLEINTHYGIEDENDIIQKLLYNKTMHMFTKQFELEDYEKGFDAIYKLLPKLKMNKLINKFDTEIHFDDEELTLLCSHTNTETNECCVCKELTGESFIICKHVLCMECFANLKHAPSGDDDDGTDIHCPVCRTRIGRN